MRDMTTQEAAASLGVSQRLIRSLLEDGRLEGDQLPGGVWLVAPVSVERYRSVRRPRGRAWSDETCWSALALLSRQPTAHVPTRTAARLRARLAGIEVEELARKLSGRLTPTRWSAINKEDIKNQLVLTSASGSHVIDSELAPALTGIEGYVVGSQEEFVERNLIIPDQRGDIVLFGSLPLAPQGRYAPEAVIAADLARSIDSRERGAGLAALERLRRAWLDGTTR